MIKKLCIVLSIIMVGFMIPFIVVDAEDIPIYEENLGQLNFNFTSLYSTYYALTATNTIEPNTEYIEVVMPQSSYHVPEAGGVDSTFRIFFDDDTYEDVYLLSVFGGQLFGSGTINLKLRYPTKWFLANEVETTIVQNITSAPGGYVAAMTAASQFNYYVNTGNFEPSFAWETVLDQQYYPTTQWYLRGIIRNIWVGVNTISFYIPPADAFLPDAIGSYMDAYVVVTDTSSMSLAYIDLVDLGSLHNGLYFLDFNDYDIDTSIVKQIQIYIPLSYTVIPPQFLTYILENSYMEFDEFVYEVRYHDLDGYLNSFYESSYLVTPDISVYPLADVGILKFKYYVYADGTVVDFTKEINPNYILNNRLNLYGFYQAELGTPSDIIDPTPDINTFTSVLNAFGLNNNVGYIVSLILVTAMITLPLIVLGVPLLVIAIVNIAITSFFVYNGLLPMIAVIILYLLWTVMIVASFRRSDIYE